MSVRKRVIKIFRDICTSQPDFEKISEICIKMIARIEDEETIKVNVTYLKFEVKNLKSLEVLIKYFGTWRLQLLSVLQIVVYVVG